jgi:hypothetical protein
VVRHIAWDMVPCLSARHHSAASNEVELTGNKQCSGHPSQHAQKRESSCGAAPQLRGQARQTESTVS